MLDPVRIFWSYSHEDVQACVQLRKRLRPWRKRGVLEEADDGSEDWSAHAGRHLADAEIVLLLVSEHYLQYAGGMKKEMRWAVARADAGESWTIPVILDGCRWQTEAFAARGVLPADGVPVSEWPEPAAAYDHVVDAVLEATWRIRAAEAPPQRQPLEQPTLVSLWLDARFETFHEEDWYRLMRNLRLATGDHGLRIRRVRRGSVVVDLEMSRATADAIEEMARRRELHNIVGSRVLRLRRAPVPTFDGPPIPQLPDEEIDVATETIGLEDAMSSPASATAATVAGFPVLEDPSGAIDAPAEPIGPPSPREERVSERVSSETATVGVMPALERRPTVPPGPETLDGATAPSLPPAPVPMPPASDEREEEPGEPAEDEPSPGFALPPSVATAAALLVLLLGGGLIVGLAMRGEPASEETPIARVIEVKMPPVPEDEPVGASADDATASVDDGPVEATLEDEAAEDEPVEDEPVAASPSPTPESTPEPTPEPSPTPEATPNRRADSPLTPAPCDARDAALAARDLPRFRGALSRCLDGVAREAIGGRELLHSQALASVATAAGHFGDSLERARVSTPRGVRIYGDAGLSRLFTGEAGVSWPGARRVDVLILARRGDAVLARIQSRADEPRPAVGWMRAADLGL